MDAVEEVVDDENAAVVAAAAKVAEVEEEVEVSKAPVSMLISCDIVESLGVERVSVREMMESLKLIQKLFLLGLL